MTVPYWIFFIHLHERKVFSQNKEDGILKYIFQNIQMTNRYYVGFGTESGKERNTRYLQSRGWTGLLMDGGNENQAINLHKEFITPNNIVSLFKKYNVPIKFDLLSIDIDSTDLWIWKEIGKVYHPRVVVTEFNSNCDLYEYWTFPNDSKQTWKGDRHFGACLSSLYLLSRQLNYTLVYVDSNYINAFFIRSDIVQPISLETIHPHVRPLHLQTPKRKKPFGLDYYKYSLDNKLPVFGLPHLNFSFGQHNPKNFVHV